jgi:antitoxin component YwqK of YwqJK toxin-antitoxin module
MNGICIWYYENGNKMEQCTYEKGESASEPIEWNEDGTLRKWHYEYENALPPTSRGISSEYNKNGQRSRTVIPVTLPENTAYYVFKMTVNGIKNAQTSRQSLIDDISKIPATAEVKAMTTLASILNQSAGDEKVTYYITNESYSKVFMNQGDKSYVPNWYTGQNIISETRIYNKSDRNKIYLCIDNQNLIDGVVVNLEVVAVVKKYDN